MTIVVLQWMDVPLHCGLSSELIAVPGLSLAARVCRDVFPRQIDTSAFGAKHTQRMLFIANKIYLFL